MYALVPVFSNKVIPLPQVISTNLNDIFEYLINNLYFTYLTLYKQLCETDIFDGNLPEASTEEEAKQQLIDYNCDDLTDCLLFGQSFFKNVAKKTLNKLFVLDNVPQLSQSVNVQFMIIKFDRSIKKVWTEVEETIV